jgi:hypothetical protein
MKPTKGVVGVLMYETNERCSGSVDIGNRQKV